MPDCTISSTRSSTTRSTRRWPGFCDQVNVTIHIDNSVTVVDNGRGIPVDRTRSGKSAAEVVLTVLHAGGKFDNDSYKVSGGLHGVGVSVVNALSETAGARNLAQRPGLSAELRARHADRRSRSRPGTTKRRGTKVTFKPDPQIFETIEFSFDTLAQRLRELAFLNGGVTDHHRRRARRARATSSSYEGGIVSFVAAPEQEQGGRSTTSRSSCSGEKDGIDAEIALQWNDGYAETVSPFANNINTHEGGTHLSGLPLGADADDQRLREREQPGEGPQGRQHQRRRHPRRA